MPDVGTLNIEITSNAEEAAKGLGSLATKLGSVKKNADGFDLSNVQTNIRNIVNAVKGSEKTMASLGTLFNATATYFKAFGKITDKININTKPIKDLKEAFGDGIKTGNVGSQLNQLRTALEGEWKTDNAYNAGLVLSAISQGAKDAESVNLSSTAKNIGSLANSLNEYASAVERINGASDTEGIKALFDVLGKFVPEGYASGIRSGKDAVSEASAEMTKAGIETTANEQKSHSPSEVYEELGSYAGEGYAEGIRSKISAVTSVVAEMVQSAIASSEGKTAKVTEAVSAAVKSAFSSALSGMDISEVQKSLIQRTADLTADVVKAMATTSKADLGQTGKIAADTITSAMSGAVDKALDVVKPLQEGMQQVNAELQTAGTTVENSIDQGIKETVSATTEMNERLQMTNEELQEQLRIRKEIMEAQNQTRLENNYPLYRELYMSGEGDWKQQVPEMYGFTEKAIEQNETYADALKATLEEVNSYVDQFIEKTNTPAGEILRDVIDQTLEAKLSFKEASESAATLKNAPELQTMSSGMQQVEEATQTANSALEKTKTATRVLTDDMKDLDKELKQKKPDAENAADGINKFGFSLKDMKTGLKQAFPLISQLSSRLKSIIIRRTLTAAIRKVVSSAKEGLENVYNYSKLIDSGFSSSMDGAASSLAQMKNALGASLAPVVQALIPYLQQLVSWFINLVNYANQFFSLLNGQSTWTRALPQTVSAFDKQTKATNGAAAAMKDLLADWDELNIIQSESGGGGGAGTTAAEDYLKMFEEVSRFDNKVKDVVDFIKNNIDDIWKVAKDIGLAILGWKFSNAFTGILGKLSSLIAVGLIVKLSADVTTLIDEAYIETQDGAFLLADIVLNAALAGVAAKIANAAFGKGAGSIAAGITLAVSAGSTFDAASKASEAGQEAEAQMLTYAGAIKAGMATALATVGFLAKGVSLPLAAAGAIAVVALTTIISFSLKYSARKATEEAEAAKQAFASRTAGGLDPQAYIDAIQQECDRLTSGSVIVIDTHVEFPNLRKNLENALTSISALNSLISGDGKLTEEDAEAFKKNWGIVLDTLDRMNTSSYDTILSGLNDALANAIGKAKEQIAELRTQFIQIERNVSEKVAGLYKEMDDIVNRISEGKYANDADRKKDIDRYNQLAEAIYVATDTTYDKVQEVMDKGSKIDFSKTGVEGVQQWIEEIGTASSEATDKIDEAFRSVEEAIGWKRKELEGLVVSGDLTREEADAINSTYDEIIKVYTETTEKKKKELNEKVNKAYSDMLQSAFATGMTPAEWRTIMDPILEKLKEAGGELPQWMVEAIQDGMQWNLTEGEHGLSPEVIAGIFGSGASAQEAVNQIKDRVEQVVKEGHGEDFYLNAIKTFGLSGLDVIGKYWKEEIIRQALIAGLDSQFISDLMNELGINPENFEIPTVEKSEMAKAVEDTVEDALQNSKIEPNIEVKPNLAYEFDPNNANDLNREINALINKEGIFGKDRTGMSMLLSSLDLERDVESLRQIYDYIIQNEHGAATWYDWYNDQHKAPDTSGVIRNPERHIGATGESSVGWGYTTNANNEAITEQDLAKAVESGTGKANTDQNAILNSIMQGVEALLRKNWTVNITPTSALGSVNRGAAAAIEKITGTIG